MRGSTILAVLVLSVPLVARADQSRAPTGMVYVPPGSFRSFVARESEAPERVAGFYLDRTAVTNDDYRTFTQSNPQWAPGKPARVLTDRAYLAHWKNGRPAPGTGRFPVVNVSWFAARAYCAHKSRRLPTIAEWERAAAAPDRAHAREGSRALAERVLNWYAKPTQLRPVGDVYQNMYGLYDMHGLVWEWTEDYNAATVDRDSREGSQGGNFCGGGATDARAREDYASFMRYAFRSSLRASSTARNLGFRCARDVN